MNKEVTMERIKSCITCKKACPDYFNMIRIKCHGMLSEEETEFRQLTAENCDKYS